MKHALLLAVAIASAVAAQEQQKDPDEARADRGVLAVLRRDGVMFPFASFRGTTWTAPWPGGLRNVELPINTESVPERWWGGWKPESWLAWFGDGASRPLQLKEPAQFPVHCAPRLGIRTNYQSSEPVPMMPVNPFPKDALAVTTGVKVEPIEIVPKSEAQWSVLAVSLLAQFDKAEDAELQSIASTAGWLHPITRAKRRSLPLRIESWYRTKIEEDVTVSYVEAVRSYPPGPEDDGCGLETLAAGWVYHDKQKAAPRATLAARVTYCDRVNATYMLPFGKIRLKDRTYWIAQISGHDSEWYVVANVSREKATLSLEYFAGSRESCR